MIPALFFVILLAGMGLGAAFMYYFLEGVQQA